MEQPQLPVNKVPTGPITLRFLVVGGIFLAALLTFWVISDEMVVEREDGLDQRVFALLRPLQTPGMTKVMTAITFFGSAYVLLPAYLLLIFSVLLSSKYRRLAWDVGAVGAIGTIILFSLKYVFRRHRPPDPLIPDVMGFSFPSGHAFSSFTFSGLVIYVIWHIGLPAPLRWLLSTLMVAFSAAIAFSRVYLHVHYASDVVAGSLLCIIWLGLSFQVLKLLDKRRKKAEKVSAGNR